MIEIAAILSAVVRHWEDFVMIFFMLALNAVSASGRNTRPTTRSKR